MEHRIVYDGHAMLRRLRMGDKGGDFVIEASEIPGQFHGSYRMLQCGEKLA